MIATLQDYVFYTQRLLHDAQQQTWPVSPDLIDYVNIARDRVCLDTLITRVLPIITLNPLQEKYLYSTILSAAQILVPAEPVRSIATVINFNVIQSSAYQPPMSKKSWTDLNAGWRTQGPTNPAAFPEVWANYAVSKSLYIANVPGSPLTAEADCLYFPNLLINLTDPENAIPDPIRQLVPLMAARWAFYYQDEVDIAEKFYAHYTLEKNETMASYPPFSGFN